MNVIVLGCGPSGLVAADTARREGFSATVFSRKQKSPIFGAQFLHQPILDMDLNKGKWVRWDHLGINGRPVEFMDTEFRAMYDPRNYLQKVYGNAWDGHIDDEMYNTGQFAWDLRTVYDDLWEIWGDSIVDWNYDHRDMTRWAGSPSTMVINTLPRGLLCVDPHRHMFRSTKIWALGQPTDEVPLFPCEDEVVIYNGNDNPAWYRMSRIFGHTTVEWPGHIDKPPIPGVVAVNKPVGTTCTCWPAVRHVGRYGQYRKGVLLHHVPDLVKAMLAEPKQGVLF